MGRGLINFSLEGFDDLEKEVKKFTKSVEKGGKRATEKSGLSLMGKSVVDAPIKTGDLRRSGYYKATLKGFGAEVGFTVPYAPYLEFGTGGYVNIPEGFEEFASQFKGKGLRQVNITPRPFLIPNWIKESQVYLDNLNEAIDIAAREFNR